MNFSGKKIKGLFISSGHLHHPDLLRIFEGAYQMSGNLACTNYYCLYHSAKIQDLNKRPDEIRG